MGGSIKDFIFNLAGPALKNLKVKGNKNAYKSMANKLLPYTGLRGHDVVEDVRGLLEKGEVKNALDYLKRHRIRYKPSGLWKNEPEPIEGTVIASHDMDSQQVYKAARRVVPYVDNVLTERLKSQVIVDSSLTQALFNDLKQTLSKDMSSANDRLNGLMSKADKLKLLLDEVLDYHDSDRVNLYIGMLITLSVCLISLTVISLMWYSVNSRVNQLVDQMSRVEEREPLNPKSRSNQGVTISHPLSATSFSFAEKMEPSPSGLKALASLH